MTALSGPSGRRAASRAVMMGASPDRPWTRAVPVCIVLGWTA
ncbi:hypothetical protein FM106_05370 [Brachybacterium faecium]|nr:hypothetical protein FM106_05370 [Brachybacterium faecium]